MVSQLPPRFSPTVLAKHLDRCRPEPNTEVLIHRRDDIFLIKIVKRTIGPNSLSLDHLITRLQAEIISRGSISHSKFIVNLGESDTKTVVGQIQAD